jgi:hypothetical protein
MLPEDLAALLLIAARDGVPSALADTLRQLRRTALAASGRPGSTGLIGLQEEAVMTALGGDGFVTIAPPLTEREKAGQARNAALAPPLVERAAQVLRRDPARLPERLRHSGDDNEILVELAADWYPPACAGAVHDTGVDLTIWLPSDWADRVHDAGLAVVDGWFVADTADPGPTGRPKRAVVLDMLPGNGVHGLGEDGEVLGNWEYVVRHATLAWDGEQPRVAPIADWQRRDDVRDTWRR